MSDIDLGNQHLSEKEKEYLIDSIKYLNIDSFLKKNFYSNINYIIKMLILNKNLVDENLPNQHLIAYLWLLKEVAEALKE